MLDRGRPHASRPAALAAVGLLAVAVMAGLPLLSYRSTAAVTASQQQVRAAQGGGKGPQLQLGWGTSCGRHLRAWRRSGGRHAPPPSAGRGGCASCCCGGSCACATTGAPRYPAQCCQVLTELRETLTKVHAERDSAKKELEEARAQVRM